MWKRTLREKVKSYIRRDVNIQYQELFLMWWNKFSDEILNEFEFAMDDECEKAAEMELRSLKKIIESDANIDNDDANVQRVLHHINTLMEELNEEVDYTNPTRADLEREEEAA